MRHFAAQSWQLASKAWNQTCVFDAVQWQAALPVIY